MSEIDRTLMIREGRLFGSPLNITARRRPVKRGIKAQPSVD